MQPRQHRQQQHRRRRRQPSGRSRYYTSQQAAAAIAAIIITAELTILTALAGYIAAVLAGALLANLAARRLRTVLLGVAMMAERDIRTELAAMSAEARADVEQVIADDLGPLARLLPVVPSPHFGRLSADLHRALQTALNDAAAAFRDITRAAGTPAEAQRMLDELAARGLTGITDRSGRRWELLAYSEMAARTAAERMHIALQVAALAEAGIDLVQVHRDSATPPCPKCAPWQRRILSLTGRTPGFPTLAQARRAGLLHPSCRDSIVPFPLAAPLPAMPSVEEIAFWVRRYEDEQAARARVREYRRAQRMAAVLLRHARRRRAS